MLWRFYVVVTVIACVIAQTVDAQFQYSRSRLPSRVSSRSHFASRSLSPWRPRPRSRLRAQPRTHRRWVSEKQPILSEVSVPSIRRSPIPGRGVGSQGLLPSSRNNRLSDFRREIIPMRRVSSRIDELSTLTRRRDRVISSPLRIDPVYHRTMPATRHGFRRNNINTINSNNVNNNNNNNVRPIQGRRIPIPVRQRRPAILRSPLTAHTQGQTHQTQPYLRPVLPVPQSPQIGQGQGHLRGLPKVLSRQSIQTFRDGITELNHPIIHSEPSVIVQNQAAVQTVANPVVVQSGPVHDAHNIANPAVMQTVPVHGVHDVGNPVVMQTVPVHGAHVNIQTGDGDSGTVVVQTKISGQTNPASSTLLRSDLNQLSNQGLNIVPQTPSVMTLPSSPNTGPAHVQTQAIVSGPQPQSAASGTLHQDLVEAFTSVIESLLVPQNTIPNTGNHQHSIAGPGVVANSAPVQTVQPSTHALMTGPGVLTHTVPQHAGMSQYIPNQMPGTVMMGNHFSPYSQFGYMNPWMSSAMMQEMMFGDTTDPPDGLTTTAAPVNVSASNVTDNSTLTIPVADVLVNIPVTTPVPKVIVKTENKIPVKDVIVAAPNTDTNIHVVKVTGENTNQVSQTDTAQVKEHVKALPSVVENHVTLVKVKPESTGGTPVAQPESKNDVTVVEVQPEYNSIGDSNTQPKVVEVINVPENKADVSVNLVDSLNDAPKNSDVVNVNLEQSKAPDVNVKVEVVTLKHDATEKGSVNTILKNDIKTPVLVLKPKEESKSVLKGNDDNLLNVAVDVKPGNNKKTPSANEQLILDIASLIRKSNADLGKLSDIISNQTPEVPIKPVPEPVPSAEQLGIKLLDKNNLKAVKVKSKAVTYTHVPNVTATVPPVPVQVNTSELPMPTLFPKGLVFTRQPEIYRTLRTILKHNPGALKKALATVPTPTNGSSKLTKLPVVTSLVDKAGDGSAPTLVSILTEIANSSSQNTRITSPDVPVMSNVIDHHVKLHEIGGEKVQTGKNLDSNVKDENKGGGLEKQIKHASITKGIQSLDTGLDLAKYLSDPKFVGILRGLLQNMARKPEVTQASFYSEPAPTTVSPEYTTTEFPQTTTEEFELEDYITETPPP